MSSVDHYHAYVHDAASFLGYQYTDASPAWVHPFIHMIVVLTPVLLTAVAVYLIASLFIRQRQKSKNDTHPSTSVRGLYPNLSRSVFKYTRKQQAILVVLSLISMPILYASLELPKQIVNNALNSSHFPIKIIDLSFDQVDFLLLLCGAYLAAVFTNSLNKYLLNVAKGYVAERFSRRLRFLIYRQWRVRSTDGKNSEIIPILGQEVESLGSFAAEFITLPLLQGGTLITIVLFMLIQDPMLGIAALTVVPVQVLLLPRLQRRVNEQSRLRIKKVRTLGGHLGSQLAREGISNKEVRYVTIIFKDLEQIRRRIFRMKFFSKALNNFLTSLTPFMFYSLGGYFVIEGRISLGALVAVLAAHKDFSSPMNDLFAYYQMVEDTRIRYREILHYFASVKSKETKPVVSAYPFLLVYNSQIAEGRGKPCDLSTATKVR